MQGWKLLLKIIDDNSPEWKNMSLQIKRAHLVLKNITDNDLCSLSHTYITENFRIARIKRKS